MTLPARDASVASKVELSQEGVHLRPGAGLSMAGGTPAIAILRVPANGADEETVTIGADVYELDRAADGVTAGRIAVTAQADDTPAEVTNALIAAINASGTENVLAIDIDANTILLVSADTPGGSVVGSGSAIATTETLAGSGNAWDAATMVAGANSGHVVMQSRVPSAAEVTDGSMQFAFPFTVGHVHAEVRVTATGVVVAWVGALTKTGNVVALGNGGAVDWAATDTVTVVASE